MTAPASWQAAIDDARSLLDTMLVNGWQEAHIVSGDTEIFIGRSADARNPMRAAPVATGAAPSPGPGAVEVATPHVATLVSAIAIGRSVEIGTPVARLRVLDEEEDLPAGCAGRISAVHAIPGALLEFGMPVVSIAPGAD